MISSKHLFKKKFFIVKILFQHYSIEALNKESILYATLRNGELYRKGLDGRN